jgi:methionyl-tRNA formyltransferase
MRAVFYGSPEAAVSSLERLLADGHDLTLVITQPDKPAGRGRPLTACAVKRFALARGLRVLQPERLRKDPGIAAELEAARPEIGVVVAYGQILPLSVLSLPIRGTLNVHFSLLPRYRGASPVAWSILNGDARTGVTVMEINEKMDEGDILSQVETDIPPRETALNLEKRLAAMGAALLSETLGGLDRIERRRQDPALATYAPKLRKEDGRLDWRLDAETIDRRVRAFTPWPSATTGFRGGRIILLEGRPKPGDAAERPPGTILSADREGLEVACGRGVYLIERLQPENKKPMSGREFSLGARIGRDEMLEG